MSDDEPGTALDDHMRASFSPSLLDRIGDQLTLPESRPDYREVPDRVLMILFASRAGSTYAGHLLANTPHFQRVAESFNPAQLSKIRADEGLADDGEALRWMIANRGTPRAFAGKCGEPGLASAWHLGFLDAVIDRVTFVLLKRRDSLAQAVSLFRAELSGRFHSPQKAQQQVRVDQYDREKIAVHHLIIEQVYASLTRFLERTGKAYRTLYYEDICADPEAFVRTTCLDLDLEPPEEFDGKVRLEILRDEINEEWVDRYCSGR